MKSSPELSGVPDGEPAKPSRPVHPLELPPKPSVPAPDAPRFRRVELPQKTPLVSYGLLGINILIYVIDVLTGQQLTAAGAKDNAAILSGEFWRLITPMFLHAGVGHLLINSYSLYILGPQIERLYGSPRFAAIYLLSGFAGAALSFTFGPYQSIGASGAIFGLVGALIPLLYRNRDILANSRRRIWSVVQVIVINLAFGLFIPVIDNWGHLGGLAGGLVLGWFSAPRLAVRFEVDGSARLEDKSSSYATWLAIAIIGGVMAALVMAEVMLRNLQLAP